MNNFDYQLVKNKNKKFDYMLLSKKKKKNFNYLCALNFITNIHS